MLKFDDEGHIFPYETIELSIAEFEVYFVFELEEGKHRQMIFEQYRNYIKTLKELFGDGFFQFVNGSFTTNKLKPNDIDVVTFVDHGLMMKNLGAIHKLKSPNISSKVDGHFSYICKDRHRFYKKSLEYQTFWENLYSFSRPNRLGQRMPKGLIKINF